MYYEFQDYDRHLELSSLDVGRLILSLKNPFAHNRAQAADDLAALGSEACAALGELSAILLNGEESEEWVRDTMRAAFDAITEAVQSELDVRPCPYHQLPLDAA